MFFLWSPLALGKSQIFYDQQYNRHESTIGLILLGKSTGFRFQLSILIAGNSLVVLCQGYEGEITRGANAQRVWYQKNECNQCNQHKREFSQHICGFHLNDHNKQSCRFLRIGCPQKTPSFWSLPEKGEERPHICWVVSLLLLHLLPMSESGRPETPNTKPKSKCSSKTSK